MAYQGSPVRLLALLLLWMLGVGAACGLIWLSLDPPIEDGRPIRTRPPVFPYPEP